MKKFLAWSVKVAAVILLITGVIYGIDWFVDWRNTTSVTEADVPAIGLAKVPTLIKLFIVVGSAILLALLLAATSIHIVPIKHLGVRMFLGKRTGYVTEGEGLAFHFPILGNMLDVDCRKRNLDIPVGNIVTTKDKTPIKLGIKIMFQVLDPLTWFDFEDPISQAASRIAGGVRSFINHAGNKPETWREVMEMKEKIIRIAMASLKKYDIPRRDDGTEKPESEMTQEELNKKKEIVEMNDHLKNGEPIKLPEYDILITSFIVEDPDLPKELTDALAKVAKEEVQKKSEGQDARNVAFLLKSFAQEAGLSEEDSNDPDKVTTLFKKLGIEIPDFLASVRTRQEGGRTKEEITRHVVDVLNPERFGDVIQAALATFNKK